MPFMRRILGLGEPADNLRIIITRHGERADLALGKYWANNMKRNGGYDPRIPRLTPRSNFHEWSYDPPLTTNGENQSIYVGRKLLQLGYPIDYCYSSPSYRAIQTANKILESQDRKSVLINIEPGLFECPAWYYGSPLVFMPPQQLAADRRFRINTDYEPLFDSVDPSEDERRYYRRSRQLIRDIIRTHKGEGGTVLLSGHGGSIEAITRSLHGLFHRRGRPEYLKEQLLRVNYCNFAILERDARTGKWTVRLPESSENPHGAQLPMQTTIPLYRLNAHPVTRNKKYNASRREKSLAVRY